MRLPYIDEGIKNVESQSFDGNQDNTLYDLQGRKVNSLPQRGIVISNHRKVIVK